MAMIGMIVRDDDPIQVGNLSGEHLFAKIGAAVDEQALRATFDQD